MNVDTLTQELAEREIAIDHLKKLLTERDDRIKQLEESRELEETFEAEKRGILDDFRSTKLRLQSELSQLREETAQQRARIDMYVMYEKENGALRDRVRQLTSDLRAAQSAAEAAAALSRSELLTTRAALSAEYRRRVRTIEEEARKSVAQLVPQESRAALDAATTLQQQLADQDRGMDRVVSELKSALRDTANAISASEHASVECTQHATTSVQLRKQLAVERARNESLDAEVRATRATAAAAARLERLLSETQQRNETLEQQLVEARAQLTYWKTHSERPRKRSVVLGVQQPSRRTSAAPSSEGSLPRSAYKPPFIAPTSLPTSVSARPPTAGGKSATTAAHANALVQRTLSAISK